MKLKKASSVYILTVGVMSLLIVGGVVSFQIFKEATKNQLTKSQLEAVKPLNGKIEEAIVINLTQRITFSNEELRFSVPSFTEVEIPRGSPSAIISSASAEAVTTK